MRSNNNNYDNWLVFVLASAKGVEEAIWLPFSSPVVPFGAIAMYLVTIAVLHWWMKERKPFQLRLLLALHNFVLCALSIMMSVGVFLRTVTIGLEYGPLAVYCGTWIDEVDERTRLWPIVPKLLHLFSSYWPPFFADFLLVKILRVTGHCLCNPTQERSHPIARMASC